MTRFGNAFGLVVAFLAGFSAAKMFDLMIVLVILAIALAARWVFRKVLEPRYRPGGLRRDNPPKIIPLGHRPGYPTRVKILPAPSNKND